MTAVMWSKSKTDVEFQYGRRLGEFNGMSSQSHLPHCRVLPLGEFTIMIPEPHVTLQGVRIPFPILKIVFRHILFLVERQALAVRLDLCFRSVYFIFIFFIREYLPNR